MLYETANIKGNIVVHEAVLGHIVAEVVGSFQGKAILSTAKGKPVKLNTKISDELKSVEVTSGETGTYLKFYLIINFGTSISVLTKNIMTEIRKSAANHLGLVIDEITIVITGVKSKKLVKRNIQVSG